MSIDKIYDKKGYKIKKFFLVKLKVSLKLLKKLKRKRNFLLFVVFFCIKFRIINH